MDHLAEQLAEQNKDTFNKTVDYYASEFYLDPAELQLLHMFRGRWHQMKMIDIGIGAGRTSAFFANVVNRYVGIDYAERMVEVARVRIGESATVALQLGDVRDLSVFNDNSFDVALFSFNGIDSMNHQDRKASLEQVHRKLRKGGFYFFSSHCLLFLPVSKRKLVESENSEAPNWNNLSLDKAKEFLKRNKGVDDEEVLERGWALLNDLTHHKFYYVTPEKQIEQLKECGFELQAAYDKEGSMFDPSALNVDSYVHERHAWISYLAAAR